MAIPASDALCLINFHLNILPGLKPPAGSESLGMGGPSPVYFQSASLVTAGQNEKKNKGDHNSLLDLQKKIIVPLGLIQPPIFF